MSVLEDIRCAAIVGLGLVGGSVARDLSAMGLRVLGFDADAAALADAVNEGIVAEPLDAAMSGAAVADVVVIAVPVDCAGDVLGRLAPIVSRNALVTDVGSTKERIVTLAASLGIGSQFVGSHPMAGDHRSGWPASRVGLFAGARVYLCPADGTSDAATRRAIALWHGLGATPVCIAAGEHDRKLASASHLPHVLSAALGVALARSGVARSDLGPGGRDMTRLAGSSPELWTAIARENAAALEAALAAAEEDIAHFRRALCDRAPDALRARFAAARAWFDEGP